jgi:class 3 adenylate cyclase
MDPAARERLIEEIPLTWGRGDYVELLAPSMASDAQFRSWWARLERMGASPSAAMALRRMNGQIDLRPALPVILVPTLVLHRRGDRDSAIEEGRYLAANIPGARFVELPGNDHLPWVGGQDAVLEEIEMFLTGERLETEVDRVLATVMFCDIVGSTEQVAEVGDRRWRDVLENYYGAIRRELARFRGREIDTAGDGFLAAFDGPARGIRCACTIRDALRDVGLRVRSGLHTGEVEVMREKFAGIAVHIGARVAAWAEPDEVLVSSTVKDLVAGSGLQFIDRGMRALKGIPGEWRLFAVADPG